MELKKTTKFVGLAAICLIVSTLACIAYIKFSIFCIEGMLPIGKDGKAVLTVFISIIGVVCILATSFLAFLSTVTIDP